MAHMNMHCLITCPVWQVTGNVLYNGKTFNDFVVERSSGYVEQIEQHYPILTVRETLDFAAWCQGAGYREGPHHHCTQSSSQGENKRGKATGKGKGESQRGRLPSYRLTVASTG